MFRPIICFFLCLGGALHAVDVASISPTSITVAENGTLPDITLVAKSSSGTVLSRVIYTLTTANGHWSLDGENSPLRQIGAYNFESTTETADKTISFTAKKSGSGTTAIPLTITVTVTDVNEAPTGIEPSGRQDIDENSLDVVATCNSTGDPDASRTNNCIWSLISADDGGLDDGAGFTIDPQTGLLMTG